MSNIINYCDLTLSMEFNNDYLSEGDTFAVAMDKDGSIYMYKDKPRIEGNTWFSGKTMGTLKYIHTPWENSCKYYIKKDDEFVNISEEEFDMLNFINQ